MKVYVLLFEFNDLQLFLRVFCNNYQ